MSDTNSKAPQLVVKNEYVEAFGALIRRFEGYVEVKETDSNCTPLHIVVSKFGNTELLKLLVSSGNVDVNYKDSRGFTALQYVLDRRNLKDAKILIDAGADVDSRGVEYDDTALHVAANNANTDMITYLLSKGADIDVKYEKSKRTPLHEAALMDSGKGSHFETIELLLKEGANVNDGSPLCCVVDNLKMVKLFLDFKVKPCNTALYKAACKGNVEIVKLLLDHGIDAKSLHDSDSKSALFGAVSSGNAEIFQLLVDYGFDVKCLHPYYKSTLLHLAANRNEGLSHYKIAEMLLKMGLDINAQDGSNLEAEHFLFKYGSLKTPLHNLVWKAKSDLKILELFLSYKPDLTIQDWHGETALVKAIRAKNVEYVQLLMDHGSDVNVVNLKDGGTPLHSASWWNADSKMIKCLLNNGANPHAIDLKGNTLIFCVLRRYCCQAVSVWSIKFFIKYSDVNVKGNNILDFDSEFRHENCKCKFIILKHFAKLQALDIPLNLSIFESIGNQKELSDYFDECTQELALAKKTKLKNSWITFFNLLVDNQRKLKNYAGNQDLVEGVENTDCLNKFPVYGAEMLKNLEKGIKRRKVFDKSAVILSNLLPTFNPTHLVIKDVLDCVSTKELSKFSEKGAKRSKDDLNS